MIVDYTCTMDMYDMICMICNSRLEYLRCTMYGSTFVPRYYTEVLFPDNNTFVRKYRYSIFVRKYIQYVLRTKVTSYVTA